MEITTGDILTAIALLISGVSVIVSFTRKSEKTDIHLTHEVEELKTLVGDNAARISKIEEAYHAKNVHDAEIRMKIAHIDNTLSDIIKPLIEKLSKSGGGL